MNVIFLESGPFAVFKWQALFTDFGWFFQGFKYTFFISLGAMILALFIGLLFGVILTSDLKFWARIINVYVEFIQNTPLLIQVLFLFNCLPFLGIKLNVTVIGIVGVGIYHGAYITQVVRNGINSVDKGQFEATYSQGFSYWQSMYHVIFHQAFKYILPPLTNQMVTLIKNTSVISIISGADIMFVANSWSGDNLYYGPAYVFIGILYFLLCFPLNYMLRKVEKSLK